MPINERFLRHYHNGVEQMRHYTDGVEDWVRGIPVTTEKAASVSFTPSRAVDGYFSLATVLPSLRAFGATPVKHKQDNLWSRFVPCDGITNAANTSIDTGIKAVDNMEMLVRFKAITGSFYLLQARQSGTATIYGISGGQSGNTLNAYGVTSGISRTAGHIYTIKMTMVNRDVTLYVRDETAGTEDTKTGTASASPYTFPSPTTIKLFGDASKVDSGVTVYRAYIKINGAMAWDMYPCVDVTDSNKVVAYDDVTHKASVKVSGSFTGGETIQPIAYAESDGTAWADTGIIPTTFDYTITYEGAIKHLAGGPNCAWGYMGGSGNLPRWVCGTYSNKYLLNANTTSQMDATPDTNNHTFVGKVYESGGVAKWASELDGVSKQDQTMASEATWATNTLSIYLFARHNADGAGNTAPATLKRWICEKNGVVIRNYQPVRVGQTVELLDLVNWQFATRTGTFTAGADIPYSQLVPDIIKVNTGDLAYGVGKNLFDGGERGTYVSTSGVKVDNDGKYRSKNKIPVVAGQTYSNNIIDKPSWFTVQTLNIFGYDAQGEFLWAGTSSVDAWSIGRPFTMPENTAYITVSTFGTVVNSDERVAELNSKFMIVEGSTAPTEYEPYHFGIHTDGSHKLTVSKQNTKYAWVPISGVSQNDITLEYVKEHGLHIGHNMVDRDRVMLVGNGVTGPLKGAYVKSGDYYGLAVAGRVYKATDSYNLSYANFVDGAWSLRKNMDSFGLTRDYQSKFYYSSALYGQTIEAKLNPDIPVYSTLELALAAMDDGNWTGSDIVAELDIPTLYSADSFVDTQLATNNKSEAWGIKVLDGTETWLKHATLVGWFYMSVPDKVDGNVTAICNAFELFDGGVSNLPNGYFKADQTRLVFKDTTVDDDVAAWKAKVAKRYADGNPIIVLYPLATPAVSTHAITKVELTAKQTYTVTAEAELPCTQQATYLGVGTASPTPGPIAIPDYTTPDGDTDMHVFFDTTDFKPNQDYKLTFTCAGSGGVSIMAAKNTSVSAYGGTEMSQKVVARNGTYTFEFNTGDMSGFSYLLLSAGSFLGSSWALTNMTLEEV